MSPENLKIEVEEATKRLLRLARESTWNKISNNCLFILSEIKNSDDNLHLERKKKIAENNQKIPVGLEELMPELLAQYNNLYDINLEIFKASKEVAIVDIRCYLKSSIDEEFRKTIIEKPPMLHCHVLPPPWLFESNKEFDINWQHRSVLTKWKLFWARQKFKLKYGSRR